jgi:SAM-dependent methyltransferase
VTQRTLQEKSEELARVAFLGGPPQAFVRIGRMSFQVLLQEGLNPSSRVLDVGCGALRVGYWLMRFLDPGRYFGIEPQTEMLELGLAKLVEPETFERARARFAHNDDFDFSVFGEEFDFVLARSIWTHASKPQIRAMLASFAATSSPGAVFLASYAPTSRLFRLTRRRPKLERVATRLPLEPLSPLLARLPAVALAAEYAGETWAGRSHESGERGGAKHSLPWIAAEAATHSLTVRLAPYPVVNRQWWLRITHVPPATS